MAEPIVKVRVDAHSGTIILNRPAKRNALSRGMLSEIAQAFRDLHQQKKVRAVILTSSDGVFSSGYDIAEMHEIAKADLPDFQLLHEDATAYRDLILTMLRFPKPIIAAVNGPAIGAGFGLALASDIVIASQTATFSIPAPRRGIVAGMVAPLFTYRVGGGAAGYWMLTSGQFDSTVAMRMGIVHEVVEDDLLWARSNELAIELNGSAHEALALTKRMLNETIGEQLSTQLTAGAAAAATSKTTEAAKEGFAAFVEKRDPEWP